MASSSRNKSCPNGGCLARLLDHLRSIGDLIGEARGEVEWRCQDIEDR